MQLERVGVVFRPVQSINPPAKTLNVPSAFYHYGGVPAPNLGTPEEQELSRVIWYSLLSDDLFPLRTSYAESRQDQVDLSPEDAPTSYLSFSMVDRKRQLIDLGDWIFDDRFDMIVAASPGLTQSRLLADIYRFPMAPTADPFEAARLLELGDMELIRDYFKVRGVLHLTDFDFYPVYQLWFLMTRFAGYPLTEAQLALAERRNKTTPGSGARILIDKVFEYQPTDLTKLLELIDQVVGTSANWVRWGNEYLKMLGTPSQPIENLGDSVGSLTTKLYTWSDESIEQLCQKLQLIPPIKREYWTRWDWIEALAGSISLYRAANLRDWYNESEGQIYLPSLSVSPA